MKGVSSRSNRPLLLFLLALPMLFFLLGVPVSIAVNSFLLPEYDSRNAGELMRALIVSLRGATGATLFILILGTPLALVAARTSKKGERSLLITVMTLPMVLPPAAAGLGLLLLFGPRGWLGSLLAAAGVSVAFTQGAVVLAQAFVAAPLYLLQATRAFETAETRYRELARIDGVQGLGYMRYILIPVTRSPLLIAALAAWARAIGEFGATIMFAGNLPGRTQTLPMTVYLGLQSSVATALGAAAILLAIAAVALTLATVSHRAES